MHIIAKQNNKKNIYCGKFNICVFLKLFISYSHIITRMNYLLPILFIIYIRFLLYNIPNTSNRNLSSHCALFASGIDTTIVITLYILYVHNMYYYYYYCGVSVQKQGGNLQLAVKFIFIVLLSCVYNRRACNMLVVSVQQQEVISAASLY